MQEFLRNFQEYMRGFIAGLNAMTGRFDGSLSIHFITIPENTPNAETFKKYLLENNWQPHEIPQINTITKRDFKAYLNTFFREAIHGCEAIMLTDCIISIINDEFGKKYNIYGHLFDVDDDGQNFLFIIEIIEESVIFNLSWSYGQ